MKVDLNLFTVFEAIYCEGNVTKAALVLNLSQPAVSHALSKLREQFDDQLFFRQGNEMKPTVVAKNAITDVREALNQLQVCLQQAKQFDPASSRKTFTLSIHGSVEAMYLSPLVEAISIEAPQVVITSSARVRRTELENKLASGDIDVALDGLIPVGDYIKHTQIDENEMVVITRKNHPHAKGTLNLEQYLNLEHVLVSSRSTGPGIEDFQLGRLGLQRKISLRCQHTLAACRVILDNDLALTVPRNVARMYGQMFNLCTYPFPIDLPNIGIHLYWHSNIDKDPANRWLREKIISAASGK
ncbi:MAG: LysR family transcriptional regulator [Kangiellaceae bacterium]|nr:LysR family transcriptional regulator [Kangiellaceae bacterium]